MMFYKARSTAFSLTESKLTDSFYKVKWRLAYRSLNAISVINSEELSALKRH